TNIFIGDTDGTHIKCIGGDCRLRCSLYGDTLGTGRRYAWCLRGRRRSDLRPFKRSLDHCKPLPPPGDACAEPAQRGYRQLPRCAADALRACPAEQPDRAPLLLCKCLAVGWLCPPDLVPDRIWPGFCVDRRQCRVLHFRL